MKASIYKQPCALSHHAQMKRSEVDKLPPHVRQITFYLSVMYSRRASSGAFWEEQYRCPLRDCAKCHNDLESLFAHIASCPKLDAAEYWCSDCRWYERISKPHRRDYTGQQNSEQARLSKLKRAFSFFKNFGRRSHSPSEIRDPQQDLKSCRMAELYGDAPYQDRTILSPGEIKKPQQYLNRTKLHQPHGDWRFELESPLPLEPDSELFGGETAQELSSRKTRVSMHTVYEPQEHENHYDGTAISDDYQVSPLLPLGTPNANSGAYSQRLSARLSSNGISSRPSPAIDPGAYLVELESPPILLSSSPTAPDQTANQFDNESLHALFSREIHKAGNSSQGNLPISMHFEQMSRKTGAGDLYDVFTVLCQEWMSRLKDFPDLLMRIPPLSPGALFELGLSTLKGVLLGRLPQSFDNVFALMVVSFSCAYILYEHHHITCWDGLLREVPRWSLLISDPNDRKLFVRIIYKGLVRQRENNGGHPALLQRISIAAQRNMYQYTSNEPPIPAEAHENPNDAGTLLDTLQSGQAVSVCLAFLDDYTFNEAVARINRSYWSSSWSIEQHVFFINCLALPINSLKERPEMIILRKAIEATEKKILCGLLRTVRQVETTLHWHCKESFEDPLLYETRHKILTDVFDQLMVNEGLNWRLPHYVTNLEEIISNTVIPYTAPSANLSSNFPKPASSSTPFVSGTSSSSVTSGSSNASFWSKSSSLSRTVTSSATSTSSSTHDSPGSLVSPIRPFSFESSSSPVSPNMLFSPKSSFPPHPPSPSVSLSAQQTPASSGGVAPNPLPLPNAPASKRLERLCLLCHRMQSKANWQRHISKHAAQRELFKCTFQGCEAVYTRHDNLVRHQRKLCHL